MKQIKLAWLVAAFLLVSVVGAQLTANTSLAHPALLAVRQSKPASATQSSQTGKTQPDAFTAFYAQFSDAVNRQDRATLKSMMSASFEWAGDGKVPAAEAVKYIDVIGTWKSFKKTVAGKTVACKRNDPTCRHYALPARRTVGPDWLVFQQGADGKWKWVLLNAD